MASAFKALRSSLSLPRRLIPIKLSGSSSPASSRPASTQAPASAPTTATATATPEMSGSAAFFEAVKVRRSNYAITAESTIPDQKIEEILATAVKHAPSSFNSQSGRVRFLHLLLVWRTS